MGGSARWQPKPICLHSISPNVLQWTRLRTTATVLPHLSLVHFESGRLHNPSRLLNKCISSCGRSFGHECVLFLTDTFACLISVFVSLFYKELSIQFHPYVKPSFLGILFASDIFWCCSLSLLPSFSRCVRVKHFNRVNKRKPRCATDAEVCHLGLERCVHPPLLPLISRSLNYHRGNEQTRTRETPEWFSALHFDTLSGLEPKLPINVSHFLIEMQKCFCCIDLMCITVQSCSPIIQQRARLFRKLTQSSGFLDYPVIWCFCSLPSCSVGADRRQPNFGFLSSKHFQKNGRWSKRDGKSGYHWWAVLFIQLTRSFTKWSFISVYIFL